MAYLRGVDHSKQWKESRWPSDSFLPMDQQNRLAENRADHKDALLNKRDAKHERKQPAGKEPHQKEKFYNTVALREQIVEKFDKEHHEILMKL